MGRVTPTPYFFCSRAARVSKLGAKVFKVEFNSILEDEKEEKDDNGVTLTRN